MANASNGHFVWYEHLTKDPKAAIAFYTEVTGWKTQPFGEGTDYVMWVGTQGPLGGVMTLPEEAAKMGAPPHWTGNVQVADVDATAALAKKLLLPDAPDPGMNAWARERMRQRFSAGPAGFRLAR